MINLNNIVQETKEFEETIRRLINDLAVLQYNNSTAVVVDNELAIRYDHMMVDLRRLDSEATRVRLGTVQAITSLFDLGESLRSMTMYPAESVDKASPFVNGTAKTDEDIPRYA